MCVFYKRTHAECTIDFNLDLFIDKHSRPKGLIYITDSKSNNKSSHFALSVAISSFYQAGS